LLFFTALYFLVYRKLVEKPGMFTAVLFGLTIALLLYSKYHGVLLILFTLLSNIKLFTRIHIYVAGITALLLLAPHLYWQYAHGFPSVQFHLLERNAPEYKISYTLDYLVSQVLVAGPFAAVVLLWSAFKMRTSDAFGRALKFTLTGIYLFFLLMTFRVRVEANWTAPAFIPLVVLSHQYMLDKFRMRRWMSRLAVITLMLMFWVRMYTIVDLFPGMTLKVNEYHNNSGWAAAIREKADGLPVFFTDSYQRPSKYWFYARTHSFSLNTVDYRRNNFNFWPLEDELFGKKAYAIYQGRKEDYYRDSILTPKGVYLGHTIENYFSFSRIRIIPTRKLVAKEGMVNVPLKIRTDPGMLQHISTPYDSLQLWLTVYEKKEVSRNIPTNLRLGMIKNEKELLPAQFTLDLPPGKYVVRFSITSCIPDWPTMNSSVLSLRVE
jgi:hypothetical protein